MTVTTEQVYADFSLRLRTFILRRVPNEADAEDLLQDIFTKIHKNIRSLKDEDSLTAWVYRITRNAIADYYRGRKLAEPISGLPIEPQESPDETALGQPPATWLAPMVRELPEKYRQALMLTELGDMSQKDMARNLGISLSAAKMRVQRGRKKLKQAMARCCHFELDRWGHILDYQAKSAGDCACTDTNDN
ncbi:MAG: RNA polymerase sigma factor SigZ [Candidatus Neomarinimicrobiota bacterium]